MILAERIIAEIVTILKSNNLNVTRRPIHLLEESNERDELIISMISNQIFDDQEFQRLHWELSVSIIILVRSQNESDINAMYAKIHSALYSSRHLSSLQDSSVYLELDGYNAIEEDEASGQYLLFKTVATIRYQTNELTLTN